MTIRDWNAQAVANTTTAGSQYQPVVAGLRDGSYVIAWLDAGQVKYQKFSAAGAKIGIENTLPVADGNGTQSNLSIVGVPGTGGFVIALVDSDPFAVGADNTASDVTIARFDANGVVLNQQQLVLAFNLTTPTVTANANGYTVAFTGEVGGANQSDLVYSNYDNGGNLLTSVNLENGPGAQSSPEVILEGNVVHAVFEDRGSGQGFSVGKYSPNAGQLFESQGNITAFAPPNSGTDFSNMALISPNRVAVVTSFGPNSGMTVEIAEGPAEFVEIPNFRPVGSNPKITALGDSTFVVSWDVTDPIGNSVIKLQQFDISGNRIGVEATLGANGTNTNQLVNMSRLADGRLVVTWQEIAGTGDGSSSGIIHQIVDTRDGIVNGNNDPAVAETLYGNNLTNDQIKGLAGADTIYGLAGADTLYGDADGDTLDGGRGDDTLYGGTGSDSLFGGLGDDEVYGGADGDILYSSAGIDLIDGEAGNDILYYSAERSGATINLNNSALNEGSALGDTLLNIERLSGTNFADVITGNSLANSFLGNGGNDRLDGGAGADVLNGGTGSDSFVFVFGQSGTTATTADRISDYTKGAVGVGDEIDIAAALTIGGVATTATAAQASIDAATGVATFAAGSATTLADALADIATSMTTGTNTVGEFAFFKVNTAGNFYQFISDGVAGVGANDVLVQLTDVTTINTINLTGGDLTILT
jgi:Ca2+-binding RTX toxin-like protein